MGRGDVMWASTKNIVISVNSTLAFKYYDHAVLEALPQSPSHASWRRRPPIAQAGFCDVMEKCREVAAEAPLLRMFDC